MSARPAAGGGRWVDVAPERLPRWLENFATRHGTYRTEGLSILAEDGAVAEIELPVGVPKLEDLGKKGPRIALLLARKGAVAVGIADGDELVASKVDTHYVQGRTAAGGWSQHRFARRRDNQAKAAAADGAAIAGRVLLPEVRKIAALVCGGDRTQVDAILAAPPLAPLAALRTARLLDVPEPRHVVLVAAIAQARAVRILVRDP
jgi:Actinobacteria/chloroflexi VLRF1 release factor